MTYCVQWREMPETASLIEAKFSRWMTHDMILFSITVEQNAVV
jgi:hypothetical protein